MPDKPKDTPEPAPKKGGIVGKIAVIGTVLAIAAAGGVATYWFVLAPMLSTDGEDVVEAAPRDIPLNPVYVALEDRFVNVIMNDPATPASTLVYGVTLECNNQMTADLVKAHMPRFVDMINKLHSSITRDELDDTLLITESIQRQALQKANDILERIQGEPVNPEIRVTAVSHQMFAVEDKL